MARADVIRDDLERIRSMPDDEFVERWGPWARAQDRDLALMRARWVGDLEAMLPHAEAEDEAGVELVAAKDAYMAKPSDENRRRKAAAVDAIQALRAEARTNRRTLGVVGDAFVTGG